MTAGPSARRAERLLPLLFFASGAAGLIYQVVWTRMLALIFGLSTLAVSTVLTVFLGGLALGSYVAGRYGARSSRPLRLYGILEAGIAAYCLLLPVFLERLPVTYASLVGGEASAARAALVRFALSGGLLLVPTTLMGATLPILLRFYVEKADRTRERAGWLYAVNTFGAVAGSYLAGYVLLQALGMRGTSYVAALVNAGAAFGALALARHERPSAPPAADPAAVSEVTGPARIVLLAFAASGFSALLYEVVWTRLLSLSLGGSVYAFSTMLTAILLGIAVGSALTARLSRAGAVSPVLLLALLQTLLAASVLLASRGLDGLALFYFRTLYRPGAPFAVTEATQFLTAVAVMIVPTLLMGASFPVAAQAYSAGGRDVGRRVGTLYAANTVGAILGAFLAGFVFLAAFGTRGTILLGASLNLLAALVLVLFAGALPRPRRAPVAAAILAGGALLLATFPRWDPERLTFSYFDSADPAALAQALRDDEEEVLGHYEVLSYEEGPVANVAVGHDPGEDNLFLQINGRIEASTTSDMANQVLAAAIPMILHASPRTVLLIGLGSGITLGAILQHPSVTEVDALELSPEVARAAELFRDHHHDALGDPRARVLLADGRNHLLATDRLYDVIISEPSKPWISGVSNLFTRDAYLRAKERLAPGGVMCQWFHYYNMRPEDLRLTLRTFQSVFPHVTVWDVAGNFFLVGTEQEWAIDFQRIQRQMEAPALRDELARVHVRTPGHFLQHLAFTEREVRAWAGTGPWNTDDRPRLEFSAPKSLGRSWIADLRREVTELAKNGLSPLPAAGMVRADGTRLDAPVLSLLVEAETPWELAVARLVRVSAPLDAQVGPSGNFLEIRREVQAERSARNKAKEVFYAIAFHRLAFSLAGLEGSLVEVLGDRFQKTGTGTIGGHTARFQAVDGRPGHREVNLGMSWYCPETLTHYVVIETISSVAQWEAEIPKRQAAIQCHHRPAALSASS